MNKEARDGWRDEGMGGEEGKATGRRGQRGSLGEMQLYTSRDGTCIKKPAEKRASPQCTELMVRFSLFSGRPGVTRHEIPAEPSVI